MNGQPAFLLPAPARFEQLAGHFIIDDAVVIAVGPGAAPATLDTARGIQRALLEQSGVQVTIEASSRPTRSVALVIDSGHGPEGYSLAVGADRIEIAASDDAGLFYGAQTLIQLVRGGGRRIAACSCEDKPALPNRGIMLDVSRGKVPTLATLMRLADVMAHYKLNQLQLYTEHTFDFASHPAVGAGCDPLTAADMRALDAYCLERHIELVANLQSTGHMRHILDLPEYAHLAETPWHWSIATSEDAYNFLEQLYADMLPAFSSTTLNVNSDEAWDFGRGQSAVPGQAGVGRQYLDHLLLLRQLAQRQGRDVMVWADVIHHYPDLIPEVPDDITLLDWAYEAAERYPTLDALAASGRRFYVCPGTSSWNTLFPRLDNARGNIRTYVTQGVQAGARGMLLTDWGDMGHYQPYANSWYPYLFGAAMAWTGGTTTDDEFDQAFGRLFLGEASGAAVAAMRRLGSAVEAKGIGVGNGSMVAYALWEDPLAGKTRDAPAESLAELRAAAAYALEAFALLPDAELRHALQFDALLIAFVGEKVQLGVEIVAALRAPAAGDDRNGPLDAAISSLEALGERLPALIGEWQRLWLSEARRAEIDITLDRYAGLQQRWTAALGWLREQQRRRLAGDPVDAELRSYDTAEYAVLWEQGARDLRKLVDSVGRDAVPPEILGWLGM